MSFSHPTRKTPEKVIMLLLGESKADYTNMLATAHDRPPVVDGAEVWTCNAGFRIWQHDLVFVMDDLELEEHRWPQYGEDLYQHNKPIITSQTYPRWPNAHAYPFSLVCERLQLNGFDRYFFNTVPYMLAYALFLGVRHVSVFGADYWHPAIGAAREADLANAEWWLGFLRGRGVGISIAPNSTLMGMRTAQRPLYGYRFDPRISHDRALLAAQKQAEMSVKPAKRDLDLSPGAQALVGLPTGEAFDDMRPTVAGVVPDSHLDAP